MNEKIVKMINEQIQKEFESAYLYLEFANFYDGNGLKGFANWYKIQALEEKDHAMKFYDFLHDNNASVALLPIEEPNADFEELGDPLKEALAHEKYVTALINGIYSEAEAHDDFRTMQFLFWFIEEQQEEEKEAGAMIDKFNLLGETSSGLYIMDRELSGRKYKPLCA